MTEEASKQLHLEERPEGLTLVGQGMELRADFRTLLPRVHPRKIGHELLFKAARLKGGAQGRFAVDATAGLGEDSFVLAAAGFEVLMFERDPVVAALAADALERARADEETAPIVGRMTLVQGDGIELLSGLERRVDVVLLDPMFPERSKSASVKKKLQLIQMLESPCEDEAALLAAARAASPLKIIVKRPAKGPHLAGEAPSYSLEGKAIRFDCYV